MALNENPIADGRSRLAVLRELLGSGSPGTQDELREALRLKGFEVTQSTISRDLRRLGAVKATDDSGRTVYRFEIDTPPPMAAGGLNSLVLSIETNGSIVVMHTTPGSASLIARHLDHYRPGGILGTIAGDDAIFIAPAAPLTSEGIERTITAIRSSLDLAS